ncbi:MYND-type zinc finger protein samB [Abortiporus biennis]
MDWNLDRHEYLSILSSMGVEIPPHSRLPDESLEKRLRQALNASQTVAKLAPDDLIDVAKLRDWPKSEKVLDAINRTNMYEAMANYTARLQGRDPSELYVNPFTDLRQTLLSIANCWDQGQRTIVVQDRNKDSWAINIRVHSVRRAEGKTPLIVLIYLPTTKADPAPGLNWIHEQISQGAMSLANISATDTEGKSLLKLLEMNSRLVPSSFTFKRSKTEKDFKVSLLLPLGPLDFEGIAKLNFDTGYCGLECQKLDWPSHKQTCKSLKGGTWRTLHVVGHVPGTEGLYTTTINRFANPADAKDKIKKVTAHDEIQPNIHGEKVFLIKMQSSAAMGSPPGGPIPQAFLIYDRQRSFEFYFVRNEETATLYDLLEQEMRGPRGSSKAVKMYRWARRVNAWELSVCSDRVPQEAIMW